MKKLIDKEKVEEILRNLWKEDDGHNSEHRICYNKALQEVQCEIDTLEVKEADLTNMKNKDILTMSVQDIIDSLSRIDNKDTKVEFVNPYNSTGPTLPLTGLFIGEFHDKVIIDFETSKEVKFII